VIHLDSSYLIDLHRETKRGRLGPALDFIETFDETEVLAVSVHVLCELRAGAELSRQALREHEEIDGFSLGYSCPIATIDSPRPLNGSRRPYDEETARFK
jgi:predicted nucleic acid-binding protein